MKKTTLFLGCALSALAAYLTPVSLHASPGGGAAAGPANAQPAPTRALVAELRNQVEALNAANRARLEAYAQPNPNGQAIDRIYNQAKDQVFLGFLQANPTLVNYAVIDSLFADNFMSTHPNFQEFQRRHVDHYNQFGPGAAEEFRKYLGLMEYMSTFATQDGAPNPMFNEYIRRLEAIAQ